MVEDVEVITSLDFSSENGGNLFILKAMYKVPNNTIDPNIIFSFVFGFVILTVIKKGFSIF